MAIINNMLQAKCEHCTSIEISTETSRLYANGEVAEVEISMDCMHRKLCDELEKKFKGGN